jgi:hypothetical protein
MNRLTAIIVTILAFTASVPLLVTTSTPTSAQELGDEARSGEIRDMLENFIDRRRMRRDERIQARGDIRDIISERLRDRDGDARERLRGRFRERLSDWRDRDDDDDDDGIFRGRLRERLGQRRLSRDGENCYFVTRSIRSEDGDLVAMIRRRTCRD